jgi:hypothetical protein
MSLLLSTPPELLREIATLLLLPDQASLARSCKALNQLLTPVVWSEVELHHSGTHEGIDIDSEVGSLSYQDPVRRMEDALEEDSEYPYKKLIFEPSSRKYSQVSFDPRQWAEPFKAKGEGIQREPTRSTDNCNRRNYQFGREESFIKVKKITSEKRWAELASYVQMLCISTGVDEEVLEVIGDLANLQSLELVGYPLEAGHHVTVPAIRLAHLRNLKLRGYFPSAVVREICSNAQQVTHLDLGLLATATHDKAYAKTLLPTGGLENEDDEDSEDEHDEDDNEDEHDDDHNKDDHDDNDGDDDDDDEDEEPYALHSPIWLPKSLPGQFLSLTHLHLVRPYTGETGYLTAHDSFIAVPDRYEKLICMEWVTLLEGVAGSLKELILEHRIPMHVGDTVGDGDPHPETKGTEAVSSWGQAGEQDPGDKLFCNSVLRLLIEHSDRFSKLKYLAFRGIEIKGMKIRSDLSATPGKRGTPDNDECLHEAYPDCNIEIFTRAYPIYVYDGSVYQGWPRNRHEAMQDEGDGLLYNLSYYNDYKKRFGPQWRIKD